MLVATIVQCVDNQRQVFLLHDSSVRFPGAADQPNSLKDRKLFDTIALPFVTGYYDVVWDRIVSFLKRDPNIQVQILKVMLIGFRKTFQLQFSSVTYKEQAKALPLLYISHWIRNFHKKSF